MRPVAIVGIGKTAFGAFADRDLRSLAVEAGEKCLRNAHATPAQVESFYLGNFAGPAFVGQNHLAPYVSTALGITGVPSTRIEAACASSGSAFFHAWTEVAAGVYDLVMVVGVEKMTSQPTARVSQILAEAGGPTIKVIAKIENYTGLRNFRAILKNGLRSALFSAGQNFNSSQRNGSVLRNCCKRDQWRPVDRELNQAEKKARTKRPLQKTRIDTTTGPKRPTPLARQ